MKKIMLLALCTITAQQITLGMRMLATGKEQVKHGQYSITSKVLVTRSNNVVYEVGTVDRKGDTIQELVERAAASVKVLLNDPTIDEEDKTVIRKAFPDQNVYSETEGVNKSMNLTTHSGSETFKRNLGALIKEYGQNHYPNPIHIPQLCQYKTTKPTHQEENQGQVKLLPKKKSWYWWGLAGLVAATATGYFVYSKFYKNKTAPNVKH